VNALLAVDIGNTNVTIGVFDLTDPAKPALAHHWRMATHREQTSDEILVTLHGLTNLAGCKLESIRDAIVSSVVPPLLPIWERVGSKLLGKSPLVVGPGIKTGMPVRYENPREVGADRIVNAVAAFELMGGPVIAVDFGTATTWDCVSEKGEYLGGAIFPGIVISMEALFERTSMLHRVELARPRSVIGRTTTQSIQAGLLFGYAGLVDSMVRRIKTELGEHTRVIATGGLAQRIAAETETIERVEPYLTLEGLRLLFEKNRAQEKHSP
jgi:type III pantothenate kinase